MRSGEHMSFWIKADADFGFGIFFTDDINEEDIDKYVFIQFASHFYVSLHINRLCTFAQFS